MRGRYRRFVIVARCNSKPSKPLLPSPCQGRNRNVIRSCVRESILHSPYSVIHASAERCGSPSIGWGERSDAQRLACAKRKPFQGSGVRRQISERRLRRRSDETPPGIPSHRRGTACRAQGFGFHSISNPPYHIIPAHTESLGFATLTANLYRLRARHAVPLQRLSRLLRLSRLKSVFICLLFPDI
jgi:hypothetical protein